MKEIKIITTTEKGEIALKQHWKETMKWRNTANRIAFGKLGFQQGIYSVNPFGIIILIKSSYFASVLKPADIIQKINETMKQNGAEENTDYKIEIVE